MSNIEVVSITQHIILNPATSSVSVINTGPQGPTGLTGPSDTASKLTVDGQLLTQAAGVLAAVTRANLADDTAFTSRYPSVVVHGATPGTARTGTAPTLWIGSVNPTNATNNDVLYRTDTTALYMRIAAAWVEVGSTRYASILLGCVGVHSLTSSFATTGTHTTFQDEGLTLTRSEVAGRRWKWTLCVHPYVPGGTNGVHYQLVRDGVVMREWYIPIESVSATYVHSVTLTHTEVIASTHASSVFKVQIRALNNNTAVASHGVATLPRQFIIEDIGT